MYQSQTELAKNDCIAGLSTICIQAKSKAVHSANTSGEHQGFLHSQVSHVVSPGNQAKCTCRYAAKTVFACSFEAKLEAFDWNSFAHTFHFCPLFDAPGTEHTQCSILTPLTPAQVTEPSFAAADAPA